MIVMARAKGYCERCHRWISDEFPDWHPQKAQMNHRKPLSLGGTDDPENCEAICQACHLPHGAHAPTRERQQRLHLGRDDDEGL